MRKLLALLAGLVLSVFAQSPTDVFDKAPPQIDAALRERIAIFFQAHVDGKFRQAEQVVHEDSRDEFYNSEKQRMLGFEIVKIDYSDHYTKATVITNVEIDWSTPRMGRIRVKPPLKTVWKYDAGQWWWYTVPKKEWETPFGTMHPGADPVKPVVTAKPNFTLPDADTLLSQVTVSKTEVRLHSSEKSEDSAEINNNMPGDLTLALQDPKIPGLTIKVDKEVLHKGETAHIEFHYEPPDKTVKVTRTVVVRANPIARDYTFTLTFTVPPEYEKYLQKK